MRTSDSKQILEFFGQRVRELREQKGFSQEKFAEVCDLDRSYIGGVERGERNVSLLNISKIVAALEIPFAQFFHDWRS